MREQLVDRERLHEVVVGTGVQTVDAVGHGVARRQHEDRQRRAALAEHAARGQAVDVRHHDVEHQEIGVVARDRVERLGAVLGEQHAVALEAQDSLERVAQPLVVLGDEDAQRRLLLRRGRHRILLCVHGNARCKRRRASRTLREPSTLRKPTAERTLRTPRSQCPESVPR